MSSSPVSTDRKGWVSDDVDLIHRPGAFAVPGSNHIGRQSESSKGSSDIRDEDISSAEAGVNRSVSEHDTSEPSDETQAARARQIHELQQQLEQAQQAARPQPGAYRIEPTWRGSFLATTQAEDEASHDNEGPEETLHTPQVSGHLVEAAEVRRMEEYEQDRLRILEIEQQLAQLQSQSRANEPNEASSPPLVHGTPVTAPDEPDQSSPDRGGPERENSPIAIVFAWFGNRARQRMLVAVTFSLLTVGAVLGSLYATETIGGSTKTGGTMPVPGPSSSPSAVPSMHTPSFTEMPSMVPSMATTLPPSVLPSMSPNKEPTMVPTVAPSNAPSALPTMLPTTAPSNSPSPSPSAVTSSPTSPKVEDRTIYEGRWGSWKGWRGDSTSGYYACGAELRYEDRQGLFGDDTTANGLRLAFCHLGNWNDQRPVVEIYGGIWGGWKGMKMCPNGYFIDGAQVRFENPEELDDETALNGLKIHCRNSSGSTSWVTVWIGDWGDWKSQVVVPGKYVQFANVRFEDSKGISDDTAMNGLKFRFKTPML